MADENLLRVWLLRPPIIFRTILPSVPTRMLVGQALTAWWRLGAVAGDTIGHAGY